MRLEVSLEPFPGLKIDLNALYEDNRRTEFQFMFEEMPVVHGGSFAMTTISLSSAFENQRAGKTTSQVHSRGFGKTGRLSHQE